MLKAHAWGGYMLAPASWANLPLNRCCWLLLAVPPPATSKARQAGWKASTHTGAGKAVCSSGRQAGGSAVALMAATPIAEGCLPCYAIVKTATPP